MDFDTKASHRKSRAPWQQPTNQRANPYALANASVIQDGQTKKQPGLQVPNPYGVNTTQSRKNTRRLSIHASAMSHGKGGPPFDLPNLPPLPNLNRIGTHNSDAILIAEREEKDEFGSIESKITKELAHGTATEIDDYYQILLKQKALITKDIKTNINQNQKNILELTDDLKATKDELLKLRVATKDLYGVFDEFKATAERRLALEHEVPNQPTSSTNGSASTSNGRSSNGRLLKVSNKRKDRSSVFVLEKMWVTELQSLFKHVDGASKYIQAIPGRHVLAESGRWYEINVGTWKATKTTHLFILNDLVLVASKKASSGQESGSSKKLQAVHCWPLYEVKISQITPPHGSGLGNGKDDTKTYAINVKSKSLSYVYRTDRYDHFLKIMDAYNKGVNELLQQNRLLDARKSIISATDTETNDEKRQLRESLRNSGIMELPNLEESGSNRNSGFKKHNADILLQDISARVHSRNKSHDFGKAYNPNGDERSRVFNDLKSVEDKLDEVDVHISHNKYYESVGLINHVEGKLANIETGIGKSKSISIQGTEDEIKLLIDVIKLKIDGRKLKIQQYLGFDLQHNINKLSEEEVAQIIEFFLNFEQLEKGISLYLQAMSMHLSDTVSKLKVGVQGSTRIDIVNYLCNLVIIFISIIKRAIMVYNNSITPIVKRSHNLEVDSSGFISWCVDEMTKLVISTKKHLLGTLLTVITDPETDIQTFQVKDKRFFGEYLTVLRSQLDSLKAVGVNVDFLFDDILSLN